MCYLIPTSFRPSKYRSAENVLPHGVLVCIWPYFGDAMSCIPVSHLLMWYKVLYILLLYARLDSISPCSSHIYRDHRKTPQIF